MNKKLIVVTLAMSLAVISCKNAADDLSTDGAEATSNVSESAVSEAGQQATSAEGASSPSISDYDEIAMDLQSMDYVDPKDVGVFAACTFAAARSACTSNVSTIDWAGCTVGIGAALTGGWTETWSAGHCADTTKPTGLIDGRSVVRTSASQVLSLINGAKLTTDTLAHTTYDGVAIPATGISVSMTSGTRTVVINGVHKVLVGPRGRTLFDHTITSSGLTVTGNRAAGTRTVNGSSVLYHNLAQYKATHTFSNVSWTTSSCCYPTSGTLSTTLTGTRSGTVGMTFTSSCGQAQFMDTNSTVSTVTLTQCN